MESLDGVAQMWMSGVRATLVLEEGATLTEDAARKALEDQGLEYGSLEQRTIERPAAAYVAVTPKFT